jgi:hypothetical protein
MQPPRKVFVILIHLNSFNNMVQQTYYRRSTENDMATLLAEKMFRNWNASLSGSTE